MIGCYECSKLTSGDCGQHGTRTIHVPPHTLIVRIAEPKPPLFACECSVVSHCAKFGGCLAECSAEEIIITRKLGTP